MSNPSHPTPQVTPQATPQATPQGTYLLDRCLGQAMPDLSTADAVRHIESIPLRERLVAHSVLDALRLGASAAPDRPALQFLPNADPSESGVTVTHAEFMARVTQAANMFNALGVGPNDVVSLLLPLLPQSFYALFGAQAAGIANPVNPLLEPHQLAEILQAAGTKVLVALGPTAGSDIWDKVQRIRHLVPSLTAIVVVGGDGAVVEETKTEAKKKNDTVPAAAQVLQFETLLAQFPGDHLTSGRVIAADDTAAYFHTGGTTGTPKLVRHSHENQVYQAWGLHLLLDGLTGRSMLFGLPLYHVGGALTQALTTLSGAGCVVILSAAGWRNPAAVRNIWKLVDRFKPKVFSGVPTVLTAAAAVPVGDADTSSIEVISGGGSAIPVAVGRALAERFSAALLEVYGMTETASVHCMTYQDRPLRIGSVGHPMPYSHVKVIKLDAAGQYAGDCGVNEVGVIAMSGPGVFSGYLSAVHNVGAFSEPGWVNSGDLGRLDEAGYLWITGREKDLIIRGGHNIDPMPIEEIFYQHPAVALVALVGQPDAYAGEVPLAYVQLKPGATATPDELLAHVRTHTPERAAVPVEVRLIDSVPLTGVGKVFKPALRWAAAEAVFAKLLAPLSRAEHAVTVSVGAHGQHGSVARVQCRAASGATLSAPEQAYWADQVAQVFKPFVMRHELVF